MTTPRKPRTNGRSRSASAKETAAEGPTISAAERGAEQIPGTSLVMHRFPAGSLVNSPWIGADGVPVDVVQNGHREIAAALASWSEDLKLKADRLGGNSNVFDRNAYVPPENIFAQMQMARRAVENDDTVGGLADSTEALALKKLKIESSDLDDSDIYNQWAAQVNLDEFIRAAWREMFTHSQYVAARWWGFEDYKVRGRGAPQIEKIEVPHDPMVSAVPPEPIFRPVKDDKGALKKGAARRKEYKGIYVPKALTILDSTKVVPLGSLLFGQERLVWTANADEMRVWQQIQDGTISRLADPIMANFFLGKYVPTDDERDMLIKLGVKSPENLLEMNPMYVWRHTTTRPHYKPWADLRLKRVFRWLDMKQQLMAADRVALVGNANYILLVTKGEKDNPATQPELDQLNQNFAYIARLPVIIGDHTLNIEIISPKTDYVLDHDKYTVIDSRIRESVLKTFKAESQGRSGDTTITVARAIARGLENVRHGIKRDFEANLLRMIFKHPFNDGKFEDEGNLVFSPRNVQLDQDPQTLQALIALNAKGDVSRMTTLEEVLDLDEETEAQRRELEALWYDPIFKTATPFNGNSDPMKPEGGPANAGGSAAPPGTPGGGGRPAGGGRPKPTPAAPANPTPARAPRGKNRG